MIDEKNKAQTILTNSMELHFDRLRMTVKPEEVFLYGDLLIRTAEVMTKMSGSDEWLSVMRALLDFNRGSALKENVPEGIGTIAGPLP